MPDVRTVYLMTEGVEAAAAAASGNGRRVIVEPMVVAENGSMAMFTDPGQAAVGVWQPGIHRGFEVLGEVGTPVWFELLTRDYAESVAFYRTVFGWDTHVEGDTPEFRYTTLGTAGNRLAGIMDATAFLPEGAPAHWSVYFLVADTDIALERIVALGGKVTQPAQDTPYGRLEQAADPTGALFKFLTRP